MPLNNETIAIIGCGTMGEATVRGLVRRELLTPDNIIAAHPRAERRHDLAAAYGIRCEEDNSKAVADAGVVVLAVKPQILAEVMAGMKGGFAAGLRNPRRCGGVRGAVTRSPGQAAK